MIKQKTYEEVLNGFIKETWTEHCIQKQYIPFEWAATILVVFCEDRKILSQTIYTKELKNTLIIDFVTRFDFTGQESV